MGTGDVKGDTGGGDVGGDEATRIENAKLAFEQTKILWDDEVAYADTLRDKRRTYATGLAVLAGLGIFRFVWTRPAGEVPVIESLWMMAILRVLLSLAVVVFLSSAYCLFTERPLFRLTRGASQGVATRRADRRGGSVPVRGAARRHLVLTARALELMRTASAEDVWRFRQMQLQRAYQHLAIANTRVNQRIEQGVSLMLMGYLVLAMVFCVYTWSIRGTDEHSDVREETSQPGGGGAQDAERSH